MQQSLKIRTLPQQQSVLMIFHRCQQNSISSWRLPASLQNQSPSSHSIISQYPLYHHTTRPHEEVITMFLTAALLERILYRSGQQTSSSEPLSSIRFSNSTETSGDQLRSRLPSPDQSLGIDLWQEQEVRRTDWLKEATQETLCEIDVWTVSTLRRWNWEKRENSVRLCRCQAGVGWQDRSFGFVVMCRFQSWKIEMTVIYCVGRIVKSSWNNLNKPNTCVSTWRGW